MIHGSSLIDYEHKQRAQYYELRDILDAMIISNIQILSKEENLYYDEMQYSRRYVLATLSFIASSSATPLLRLNRLSRNYQLYKFQGKIASRVLTLTLSRSLLVTL